MTLIMASYMHTMHRILWCLFTVFLCSNGQMDMQRSEIGLCEKIPGFEPSGAHLDSPGDNILAYVNWNITDPGKAQMCLMRFTTCDSCRLRVAPVSRFEFTFCALSDDYSNYHGWCISGCSYLLLYDKDYSSKTEKSYSSFIWTEDYVTESRTLYVVACSNRTVDSRVVMKINISSEQKTAIHEATSLDVSSAFTMTSPFFPSDYVLNSEKYIYIFRCASHDQFVTLSFDDWQLASTSSVTFENANVVGPFKGSDSRPWVISNSYQLVMTFDTGTAVLGDHMGFQATYTFQTEKERQSMPATVTSCGNSWITQSESGTISFSPTYSGRAFYDCIWVIKKVSSYDGVLLKVINYSLSQGSFTSSTDGRYQPNILQIRSGLTSSSQLKQTATPAIGPTDQSTFSTLTSTEGFYVRLKGGYSNRDFVFAYSSYNTGNCKSLFQCSNGICIPSYLRCDGVDHCGDYSDEAYLSCGPTTSGGSSGGSYPGTLGIGIIIPMVVSIFLIIVICLLVVFIRRCRKLSYEAHRARQFGQHINTVSGAISSRQRRNRRRGNGSGVTFEPPPPYEEVLNTTPIGYLNMAFHDAHSNPLMGLLQPPSYDEAMTPTDPSAPSGSHDLSSDSSSPDTGVHSQSFFSSYSSDDTQPGGEQNDEHQGHLHRSLSGDTSSDDMDHDDAWHSVAPRPEVIGDQPSSCRTIAKPVYENVCTVALPANGKPNKKYTNNKHRKDSVQQENEDGSGRVILTAALRTTPGDLVDGVIAAESGQPRRLNQAAVSEDRGSGMFCQIESSPVLCAPPVPPGEQGSALTSPQTPGRSFHRDEKNPSTQGGKDAELATPSQREYSPHKRYARNPNMSESRQVEQPAPRSGHDAGKRRHPGKNGQTPYSLLSRSMVDISGQNEGVVANPLTSTKMLSKSVDNVLFASLTSQFSQRVNNLDSSRGLSRASSSQGLWQDSSPQAEGCAVSGQTPSSSNLDTKDHAKPTPRPRKSVLKKASSGHAACPDERPQGDEPQHLRQHGAVEASSPSQDNSGRNKQNQRPVLFSEGRIIPDNRNNRPIQNVSKDSLENPRERPGLSHEGASVSDAQKRHNRAYPDIDPTRDSYSFGRPEGRGGADSEPGPTQGAGHPLGKGSRKPRDQMVNSHGQEKSVRNVQPSASPYEGGPPGPQPRVAMSSSEMAQTSGRRSALPRNPSAQMPLPDSGRQSSQGNERSAQPDFPQDGGLSPRQNAPQQPRYARAGDEFDHRNDRPMRSDGRGAWPEPPQHHGSGKRASHPPKDASGGGHISQGGLGRPGQDVRGRPQSELPHHPRLAPGEKMPPPYSPRDLAPAGEVAAHGTWHTPPPAYSKSNNRNPARDVRRAVDGPVHGNPSSRPSRSADSRSPLANSSRDRREHSETRDRLSKPRMMRENSSGSRMDYPDGGSRNGAISYRTGDENIGYPQDRTEDASASLHLEDSSPGDMFV